MRHLVSALFGLWIVANSAIAHADVGPPPKCPDGTHRQYLHGHRCVTDGYHLELNSDGRVEEVRNGTTLNAPKVQKDDKYDDSTTSPSTIAPTQFATPPTTAAAPSTTPPAEPVTPPLEPVKTDATPSTPPAQRGCACGVSERSEKDVAFGFAFAAAMFAAVRRSRSTNQPQSKKS